MGRMGSPARGAGRCGSGRFDLCSHGIRRLGRLIGLSTIVYTAAPGEAKQPRGVGERRQTSCSSTAARSAAPDRQTLGAAPFPACSDHREPGRHPAQAAGVTNLRMSLGDGNDSVTFDPTLNGTIQSMTVDGGAGDDSI